MPYQVIWGRTAHSQNTKGEGCFSTVAVSQKYRIPGKFTLFTHLWKRTFSCCTAVCLLLSFPHLPRSCLQHSRHSLYRVFALAGPSARSPTPQRSHPPSDIYSSATFPSKSPHLHFSSPLLALFFSLAHTTTEHTVYSSYFSASFRVFLLEQTLYENRDFSHNRHALVLDKHVKILSSCFASHIMKVIYHNIYLSLRISAKNLNSMTQEE